MNTLLSKKAFFISFQRKLAKINGCFLQQKRLNTPSQNILFTDVIHLTAWEKAINVNQKGSIESEENAT